MEIEMEFEGLDKLQEAFQTLATDAQVQQVERRIVTRCRDYAAIKMAEKVPKSRDNSKSGKKGYRPPGHAASNVPVSGIRTAGGLPFATVGWEKADSSAFFYVKFIEWGTHKMQPRDFIYTTLNECRATWDRFAENEIQSFISDKLGG